jgi:hypothetical protein
VWSGPTGEATPQAVARAYVDALNRDDRSALEEMFYPEDKDYLGWVTDRLRVHGSKGIQIEHLEEKRDFGPEYARVRITGHGTMGRYQQILRVGEHDGSWYLLKGNPTAW